MKLAIVSDFVEEGWPSMDLVADELLRSAAELPGVEVGRVQPRMLGPFAKLAPKHAASYLVKNAEFVAKSSNYYIFPGQEEYTTQIESKLSIPISVDLKVFDKTGREVEISESH